ncbi:MAG: rhodanese-like domain-containing protein, partial [Anaerolineae bacterium]
MKRFTPVLLLLAVLFGMLPGFWYGRHTAVLAAPKPVSTPENASYFDLLSAAEKAYAAGDFSQALDLARQAALAAPERATSAWEIAMRAAVAQAGDTYLQGLPPSRYRIDPLHFLANQVNGTSYFIIDVREPEEYAAGHIEGA